MEKFLALDGSHSFPRNHEIKKNANAGHSRHASENLHTTKSARQHKGTENEGEQDGSHNLDESSSSVPELNLTQVWEDVDRFIDKLSSSGDDHESNPSEIPKSVDWLCKMVEFVIIKYESNKAKFGQNQDEVGSFLESLKRVSKLMNKIGEFSTSSTTSSSLNKASVVLHRAMSLLDDEFRVLLENKRVVLDMKTPKTPKQSSFSFSSHSNHESDRCPRLDNEPEENEEFPNFSAEAISNMNKIATAMIAAGYEAECCMLYNAFRRNAFKEELNKLGFDSITIDDVHKMQWESLEREVASWTSIFKHCFTVLFSGERKLSDSVFSEYPSISQKLFSDLATAVITRFLSFAEAVALTKRSTERLFKFLDMFESLSELNSAIDDSYSRECVRDLMTEISVVKSHLAEAAASIFCELENSIKSDQCRTPVPSGQVHPLTRYTMNYLKYACEYKETLEEVFKWHQKNEGFNIQANELNPDVNENVSEKANDDGTPKKSPFAIELITVMDLLDSNLDMKSRLYRDPALRYIFLMNNGRYILQKIKGSTEIHNMMGVTWCRKRSTDLRQYHKNYQRETWSRVLQCIRHEGLQSNGKIVKTVLKERFKNFNTLFDEIHRTQSTWVVSDEQLQSELRVSISAVVIPAYRSFLGRFKQYLEGRNSDKYIKYQPEDIETLIDELFDGNPMSMGRRKN